MSSALRLSRSVASASMARRAFTTSRVARDHFLEADAAGFKKRVLDEGSAKPILVDFYASWCQPCRVLTPLLKGVTGPETEYDLMTLDVDQHPDLAAEYKVSALPTVVAFKNGKVANKFGESKISDELMVVGFRPEPEVKKFLGLL